MMRTAVVTGAAGFLGRNLASFLLQKGTEVYAVVRSAERARKVLPDDVRLHIIEYEEDSEGNVKADIPENADVLYHFAWEGFKPEYRKDFWIQVKNIPLTLSYLKLAVEKKVGKVVLPGSTNEYLYCGCPVSRNAVPSPSDDYGSVKLSVRYLVQQFAREKGIPFCYAVITGIYAADRKDSNIIFHTIDKLFCREKPSVTKLEQLWDYVYIDDAVEALYLIGEKGRDGALYAVGHGDNWPLRNYVEIIHRKIDPSLPLGIGEVPYASDKMPMSCVDMTDLTADTGYIPKVSFEEGITRVIETLRAEK